LVEPERRWKSSDGRIIDEETVTESSMKEESAMKNADRSGLMMMTGWLLRGVGT
jgi:hypothetical protein